jgi:hypothetical protein
MKRAWLIVVLMLSGCGSDQPTPAPTPLPPPSADVHQIGDLNFPSCTSVSCTYQGTIINAGPHCAQNVRGVTHLFASNGTELESQQWSVPNTLRLAEQVIYSGCCFTRRTLEQPGTYRSDVFATPIRC